MSTLSSRSAHIKEKLRDSLASMTPRDRTLLLGVAIFFTLVGLIGSSVFILGTLQGLQEEITTTKSNISSLEEAQQSLNDAKQNLQELEEKISKYKTTDLSAFLSKSAQNAGIKEKVIDRVREKNSVNMGDLIQKSYSVPLKELTLSQFSDFLFEIETAEYPFEIQTCSIRTRKRKGEIKLRVELDILAYQLTNKTKEEEK